MPGALALLGLFGAASMAWIVVRWLLIDDRLWLQPVMFAVGALITALGTSGPSALWGLSCGNKD